MASTTTPELNWSGTYTYAARQIHRLRTIADLQGLIETARSSLHALGTDTRSMTLPMLMD